MLYNKVLSIIYIILFIILFIFNININNKINNIYNILGNLENNMIVKVQNSDNELVPVSYDRVFLSVFRQLDEIKQKIDNLEKKE